MGKYDGLVIGVDADDVLYDWINQFIAESVERYPHITFPYATGYRTWNLTEGLDAEGVKAVEEIKNLPGFYYDLKPLPGALSGLEYMEAEGATVFIVTSPMISNPTCASDKHNAIARDFGTKWAKRVVITEDKTIVDLDFLIDDKPEITGYNLREGRKPKWEQIVFDQPCNRHVDAKLRLHGWAELPEVLNAALWLTSFA